MKIIFFKSKIRTNPNSNVFEIRTFLSFECLHSNVFCFGHDIGLDIHFKNFIEFKKKKKKISISMKFHHDDQCQNPKMMMMMMMAMNEI